MATSNKSGLKSGSLKYSDVFVKWEKKLFLPLQCKSNDIKKACLTSDSSSLDCIYKMYFRIFWLTVIFKGKRPTCALQAILEALLFTSKYHLQNWRCAFSICEPSQDCDILEMCDRYLKTDLMISHVVDFYTHVYKHVIRRKAGHLVWIYFKYNNPWLGQCSSGALQTFVGHRSFFLGNLTNAR